MRYLRQSTSVDVPIGPFLDNVDGFSAEVALTITQPDIRLKKGAAAWAQKAAAQTLTHEENGFYEVTLDATDTDTIGLLRLAVFETGALPVWEDFHVLAANVYDSLFGAATDKLDVNVEEWNTTAVPAEHTAGYPVVTVKDGTGTGEINTNAGAIALVDLVTTTSAVTTVNGLAAGVITAASIATGAIDADALAADAVTEIRSLASGTSDSGSTTTMVDAARTEADTDYWKGCLILFTSGTISGQVRLITAFDPGTDTITFAPATTQAVSTQTYEILSSGRVDLHLWAGVAANALISGRVDANSQVVGDKTGYAIGTGGIVAGSFATGAIDAAAIAVDAVTEIRSLVSGTSDSGSTTTMVDAARTEADTDYWKGALILFTSGTISGQVRLITGFNATTDTITFTPATTQAVSTQTYEILPAGAVDVAQFGSTNGTFASGRPEVNTTHVSGSTVIAPNGAGYLQVDVVQWWASTANVLVTGTVQVDVERWKTAVPADLSGSLVAVNVEGYVAGQSPTSAIETARLDELLNADSDIDGAAPPVVGSVFHELMTKTAGSFTYDQATDSLEAIRDRGDTSWTTATSVTISAGGITAGSFAAGAIDNAAFNVTETLTANPAAGGISASSFAAGAIDSAALAASATDEIANALLDLANGVETGETVRQWARLVRAAIVGKSDGFPTGPVNFRDRADTKNRITATVSSDGNRSVVTTDAT